jgi:hypothetical protein
MELGTCRAKLYRDLFAYVPPFVSNKYRTLISIPLLDAPHVAPLIIPQWRRPDRRDRVTVPHDASKAPCRFQPKYILESPKSPITETPITQSFQSRFRILSTDTTDLWFSYSTHFDSYGDAELIIARLKEGNCGHHLRLTGWSEGAGLRFTYF